MKSTIRRILSSPWLRTAGTSYAIILLNVVSGVVLARGLSVDGRGGLALAQAWPVLAAYLCDLGITPAITYFVAKRQLPTRSWFSVLTKSTIALTTFSAIIAVVGVTVQNLINYVPILPALILCLLYLPLATLSRLQIAVLHGQADFTHLNFARLSATLVSVCFLVVLYISGSLSVITGCLSLIVGQAISASVANIRLRRTLRGDVARVESPRELLRWGIRAHLGAISPVDGLHLDLIFIGIFLSAFDAGLYTVAVAPGSVVRVGGDALGLILIPKLVDATKNRDQIIRRGLAGGLAVNVLVALVVLLATPVLLPLLYGLEFEPSIVYAQLLSAGAALSSMRVVIGDILRALGRPGSASAAEGISLVTTSLGLLFLVPVAGLSGAVFSVIIAYAISLIVQVSLLIRAGREMHGEAVMAT